GRAEHVEHVHRLPEIVEQRHVECEESCAHARRKSRGAKAARQQPPKPHIQQMEYLDHRYVLGEIETEESLSQVEVQMPDGTEIMLEIARGGDGLQVFAERAVTCPAQIVDIVGGEVSLVSAAIRYEENHREQKKKQNPLSLFIRLR